MPRRYLEPIQSSKTDDKQHESPKNEGSHERPPPMTGCIVKLDEEVLSEFPQGAQNTEAQPSSVESPPYNQDGKSKK